MSTTADFTLKFHEDLSKQYPKLMSRLKSLKTDAGNVDIHFLSDGLRKSFVDAQQEIKTFFSGIVNDEYVTLDAPKEKSLSLLEARISERTEALERVYEKLTGESVDMNKTPAPMVWERTKVEEQLAGKTTAESPISPRLDDARRLYANITSWQDTHGDGTTGISGEVENLRAVLFDFIREMDNTLSGAEMGMTNEQSAYWRWSNMDGSYMGGTADEAKGSESSFTYDELVETIKEVEKDLKSTDPTDIESVGKKSKTLETLNQRRYMMGAMLGLENEPNSVQTQINKKRKLINGLYGSNENTDALSAMKAELKKAKSEVANAVTVEAKVEAQAKVDEIQAKIDEATNGRLTIKAEAEPTYVVQGSMADKRQSYANAQAKASRIQQDFEIGLIGKDEAEKEIEALNKQISELGSGLKPLKIEVDSKGFEKAMGRIKDAWGGVQGIGSGIESITDALEDDEDAWSVISGVISGFISIAEGIQSIVAVVQLLTSATHAHTAAKTAEATATGASTAAQAADATGKAVDAAATVPVVAANKLATASFLELASASYFAAHAYIPFAGFGIASGFATAAVAMTEAVGALAFATGGIVPGTSRSGDKVIARVNSGEMILNAQQQARLFAIANGAAVYGEALGIGGEWRSGLKAQDVKAQLQTLQRIALEGQTEGRQKISLKVRGRDLVQASGNELRSTRKRSNLRG